MCRRGAEQCCSTTAAARQRSSTEPVSAAGRPWERTSRTTVVGRARAKGHLSLAASLEGLEELGDRSLALVRLNHVIEHLYRPKEVLSLLARKLELGGVLHVATPNPDSWGGRIFHWCWLGLDCPRHVGARPLPTLGPSSARAGVHSGGDVHHEVLTKDLARSIGHLLYAVGALPHSRIFSMVDRQLEVALAVPARLAAYRGASDRFHCLATK